MAARLDDIVLDFIGGKWESLHLLAIRLSFYTLVKKNLSTSHRRVLHYSQLHAHTVAEMIIRQISDSLLWVSNGAHSHLLNHIMVHWLALLPSASVWSTLHHLAHLMLHYKIQCDISHQIIKVILPIIVSLNESQFQIIACCTGRS